MQLLRVMLADDNVRFRTLLRRLLERDAEIAVVAEAGTGAQALDLAAEHAPDVVVMDVSMPELDGVKAAAALKGRAPQTSVVMLSVYQGDRELAASLSGGASEYLVKGGPAHEIVSAIKRHRRAVDQAPASPSGPV